MYMSEYCTHYNAYNVYKTWALSTGKMHFKEIRHRLQQRSIVDVVRERRERWRVKVMEKPESLVERVMVGEIEGRRPRGRPRKRWGDAF